MNLSITMLFRHAFHIALLIHFRLVPSSSTMKMVIIVIKPKYLIDLPLQGMLHEFMLIKYVIWG